MNEHADLLSADTVGPYLVARGLVAAGAPVEATALGGGVSNVVLAVRSGEQRYVVKQALPRLRVAEEWVATRERIVTEAAALHWAHAATPSAVPALYDTDTARWTITIEHAPEGWRDWKSALLSGSADPGVAARLGEILGIWHGRSRGGDLARFDDREAFYQLRVDPYYRTIAERHPDLAATITGYIEAMAKMRRCLVHGDYSPKNVLLGTEGLWVVDFEVAHLGDPSFDVAFMLNHLMLKAIHRPAGRDDYRRCAGAFWRAYRAAIPPDLGTATPYVHGHVACLMLARVDGKSPAEYLSERERRQARTLARTLLIDPPATPGGAWRQLEGAIGA